MNRLFSVFHKKNEPARPIFIVSGLPRSGTSMMMKMLAEGGLPIMTDEKRVADDDNPNGYFELELVKQMAGGNTAWLKDAGGKVVKVISSLLEYLHPEYFYKVVFMEREIKEILASQRKMLSHRNESSQVDDVEMEEQFRKHLAIVKSWLVRQPNMEVLYVNYNELLSDPGPFCRQIVDFLQVSLNKEGMLSIPNRQLYRNRLVKLDENSR